MTNRAVYTYSIDCMHNGKRKGHFAVWKDDCNHCACFNNRTGNACVRCTSHVCPTKPTTPRPTGIV